MIQVKAFYAEGHGDQTYHYLEQELCKQFNEWSKNLPSLKLLRVCEPIRTSIVAVDHKYDVFKVTLTIFYSVDLADTIDLEIDNAKTEIHRKETTQVLDGGH